MERWSLCIGIITTLFVTSLTTNIYAADRRAHLLEQCLTILRKALRNWQPEHLKVLELTVRDAFAKYAPSWEPKADRKFVQDFKAFVAESIARSTPPHKHIFVRSATVVEWLAAQLQWRLEVALKHRRPDEHCQREIIEQLLMLGNQAISGIKKHVKTLPAWFHQLLRAHIRERCLQRMHDFMFLGLKRPLTKAETEKVDQKVQESIERLLRAHKLKGMAVEDMQQHQRWEKFAEALADNLVFQASLLTIGEPPSRLSEASARMAKEQEKSMREWQHKQSERFRKEFAINILEQSPEKMEQQLHLVRELLLLLRIVSYGTKGILP